MYYVRLRVHNRHDEKIPRRVCARVGERYFLVKLFPNKHREHFDTNESIIMNRQDFVGGGLKILGVRRETKLFLTEKVKSPVRKEVDFVSSKHSNNLSLTDVLCKI